MLDYDPLTRTTTKYWYDDTKRQHFLTEHIDVREVIETNKALRNQTDERARFKEHPTVPGTHIATIPMTVAMDWMKKTNWGKDKKAVNKLFMDPANRGWLTRHFRYGVL